MRRGRCTVLSLVVLAMLAGCERGKHDMYAQPRYDPQAPSPLFADGNSARTPPAGTVPAAAGAAASTSAGRLGRLPAPQAIPFAANSTDSWQGPQPLSLALLQRGRERYEIYCAPCHGSGGDGDGMVVRRGFPAPPSYHAERLREASDLHLYEVIGEGYGVMYPYADRVAPADRWAIVAYIRALQLSRHAPRDRLEPRDLSQLPPYPATPAGKSP